MSDPIQVEGLAAASRALGKFEPDLRVRLREIAKQAAEEVASSARTLVPMGKPGDHRRGHPGLLRATIRAGSTARSGTVKAGGRRAPYGPAIHFGWARRHIAPQPFLYEALDRRRTEVVENFTKGIEGLITDMYWGN